MIVTKKALWLAASILVSITGCEAERSTSPDKEFKPEGAGRFYRFSEPLVYLVLDDSSHGILERNNNIRRILATVEQAAYIDMPVKESIDPGITFEVLSGFSSTDMFPAPAHWSAAKKRDFERFRQSAMTMHRVKLRDESGVISTASSHNFRSGYDVSAKQVARDEVVSYRPYSTEVTPKVRNQLVKFGKALGGNIPTDESEFIRYAADKISPKVMSLFKRDIVDRCSVELEASCSNIYNVHELIHCLAEPEAGVSERCRKGLSNVIGSEPMDQAFSYGDVELPAGTSFIYRNRLMDSQPTQVVGVIVPEGSTAVGNGMIYGPGRLGFSRSKKVTDGRFAYPQLVDDVKVKGRFEIDLNSGRLRVATLAENTEIDGILYAAHTEIVRTPTSVFSGTLATPRILDGFKVMAGFEVLLDDRGVLLSVRDTNNRYVATRNRKGKMIPSR